MSGGVEGVRRDALSYHEQMLEAQAGCVPCKLCGGKAVITDAGAGAGYYIRCDNSLSFRDHKGCMLDERRSGGWAYNVMEWWNRLHTVTAPPARTYAEGVSDEDVARIIEPLAWMDHAEFSRKAVAETDRKKVKAWLDAADSSVARSLAKAAAIRLLSQGEKA